MNQQRLARDTIPRSRRTARSLLFRLCFSRYIDRLRWLSYFVVVVKIHFEIYYYLTNRETRKKKEKKKRERELVYVLYIYITRDRHVICGGGFSRSERSSIRNNCATPSFLRGSLYMPVV